MHILTPQIGMANIIAPVIVSGIFIALTSLFKEPTRQQFSALMIAGAGFVYFGGGFRFWEVGYGALFLWLAFRSLTDYRFVGVGWMLHVGWDILHHLYGRPILPFIPLSSLGCAICDTGIAVWYFLEAPSIWRRTAVLQTSASSQ
jgi:hypothetical protein